MPDTSSPITDKRALIGYLEAGCKHSELWRIGTEHEKFVYRLDDLHRVPYEGTAGIGALLEGLTRFGWTPVHEADNIIALEDTTGCSITLEPGGQVELSGAPLRTIHQTCEEVHEHLRQVREVSGELGIGMIGLGFDPKWRRDEMPWMPKGRYGIMRRYMPTKGGLGLDMMTRTCTVQVNLDFSDEADMVRKFRVSLALQPIGDLPFVFETGFGFERYVDYMLDVPMYFVYRDGRYIDTAGQSFRAFLDGKLPALPGEVPTLKDWTDHLTTAFPEVRLKRYLEMRGADGGPWRRLCALPALWVGLLYHRPALHAAWEMVKGWSAEERETLRRDVPRLGLATPFRDRTVRDVALDVLEIARSGLAGRARLDGFGETEEHFLGILMDIAESGQTPADVKLKKFESEWNGSIDPIFREYAY